MIDLDTEDDDTLGFNFEKKNNIIKVLGVGGGGGNAVNHMFACGIKDVDFIIANTDNQALAASPIPTKIQIGASLTQGLGAGNNPEHGKQAATESIDDIKNHLVDNDTTKMLFVTAGLGGGTGTGAAPVIAKISKEMGILTIAIVTIPFRFEGPKRVKQALAGLEELSHNVDSLLVIDNEKIREMYGEMTIQDAFTNADNVLTMAAKGIAEIITVTGSVNVDFADVKTVMENSGVALMGTGKAEGEDRAKRAIMQALNSPLLNNNNIQGSKNILVNVSSGENQTTLNELAFLNEFIQSAAGANADLIWGNSVDPTLGEAICVTLIATGFDPQEILNPYEHGGYKPKVNTSEFLDQTPKKNQNVDETEVLQSDNSETTDSQVKSTANASDFVDKNDSSTVKVGETIDLDSDTDADSDLQDQNVDTNQSEQQEMPHATITETQFKKINLTTGNIEEYENTPAYIRKGIKLNGGNYNNAKYQKFPLNEE